MDRRFRREARRDQFDFIRQNLPAFDEARRERRDAQRRRVFTDEQMQHRCVPGNRAAGKAIQRPSGPLARAQQERLNGFLHDSTLHSGEVLRFARGLDARDHVVAKTDLFIERAGPRQHFAGDEIHEQHDHGGGAHIHGKRGVTPAGHKGEQRLVSVRNRDFKCLADLRPMLDART